MLSFFIFSFLVYGVDSRVEKRKYDDNCLTLKCKSDGKVCGIRPEGEGFKIRFFQDECALLNYKCAAKDNLGYDLISMFYCLQSFHVSPDIDSSEIDPCEKFDCPQPADDVQACGLRQDGKGFRIRIFRTKCALWKHNCENNLNFTITDSYICNGLDLPSDNENPKHTISTDMPYKNNIDRAGNSNEFERQKVAEYEDNPLYFENNPELNADNATDDNIYIATGADLTSYDAIANLDNDYTTANYISEEPSSQTNVVENKDTPANIGEETIDNVNQTKNNIFKNIIVVRGLLNNPARVNETINRFFSATHDVDLPLEEMPTNYLNETTRRGLIKVAGPIKVFIPIFVVPKNISNDIDHRPTLNSCFHKCPTKCPATYAPVCGVPGRSVREPSLMFLNHCFMDVAQCKQFNEKKSATSHVAAYIESQFVFCMGLTINYMYYFLPLLKTLQHIGRLPKKGRFRYQLSNLKFFNNHLRFKNPNLQG